MLMDILGIMIGFCGVMLIFSLLVTAIVHGTQAMLNMRVKNMRYVVARFMDQFDEIETQAVLDKMDHRIPDNINPLVVPTRGRLFTGPIKLSVVSKQELESIVDELLSESKEIKDKIKGQLDHAFEYLEEVMAQRFKQWMHQLSIAVAFLLAFTFQLNTFDLIKQLNQDALLRYKVVEYSDKAVTKDDAQTVEALSQQLNAMDFQLFREGWEYYAGSVVAVEIKSLTGWSIDTRQNTADHVTFGQVLFNWFGVICSAIFISLGAPFWFNSLKNVLNLRDKLAAAQSSHVAQRSKPTLQGVPTHSERRNEHG